MSCNDPAVKRQAISDIPFLLVTHPSLPARNVKEMIAPAKSRPGEINYGSTGNGSTSHLTMAMLGSLTGTKMVHIPYKGSAPATADLAAGHLQAIMPTMPAALPFVKSGRLRALVVSSAKRWPTVPRFPTVAEFGVPGFEVILWTGVLAPAGTSKRAPLKIHISSFPRRRESSLIKHLVPRLRGDDGIFRGALTRSSHYCIARSRKF